MDGYIRAWESNDPDDIRALFTADALYFASPDVEPVRGVDEIVQWWLGSKDERGSWTFEWHPLLQEGDRAAIQGRTGYEGRPDYRNLWVMDFAADGRATTFTEWWVEEGAFAADDGEPGMAERPGDRSEAEESSLENSADASEPGPGGNLS
jgi:hypothetical protein